VLLVPVEAWDKVPKTSDGSCKTGLPYAYDKVNRVEVESCGGQGHARARRYSLEDHRARGPQGRSGRRQRPALAPARPSRLSFLDESGGGHLSLSLEARRDRADLGRSGKEPEDPVLGLSGTVRAGEVTAVAASAGTTGPVVIVDAKDVRDLSKSAADLRDKSVVGLPST